MDWICPKCNLENPKDCENCKSCGHKRMQSDINVPKNNANDLTDASLDKNTNVITDSNSSENNDNKSYKNIHDMILHKAITQAPSGTNVSLFDSGSASEVPINLIFASFWRRFFAYALDLVFFTIIATLFNIIFVIGILTGTFKFTITSIILMIFLSYLAYWLYFALLESSKMQATVGKLICGIIVIDKKGERISFLRALVRNIFKSIVSSLPTLLNGLGLFLTSMGFAICDYTQNHQTTYDFAVGTTVIIKNPGPKKKNKLWGISQTFTTLLFLLITALSVTTIVVNTPPEYDLSKNVSNFFKISIENSKPKVQIQYQTFQNNSFKYKLICPNTFTLNVNTKEDIALLNDLKMDTKIKIIVEKTANQNLAITDYAKNEYSSLTNGNPELKASLNISTNEKLGGLPSYKIYSTTNNQDTALNEIYGVTNNGYLYTINFQVPNRYKETTDNIIKSFEFIK